MEIKTSIRLKNLKKVFGFKTIIEDLSIEFEEGMIYSILAPSGAGKTTLLRLIAGLDNEYQGKITFGFVNTSSNIGFIFQEPSIFPWLNVKDNILFGMTDKKTKEWRDIFPIPSEIYQQLQYDKVIEDLGLRDFADYLPKQLSGGQKQRVVFGRSLIMQPKILLCDEPFASLDEFTRQDMREMLLSIHKKYQPTILFVTHNTEEALFLGNKVVILSSSPLKLLNIFNVDLPPNRDEFTLASAEFLNAKLQLNIFNEKQRI